MVAYLFYSGVRSTQTLSSHSSSRRPWWTCSVPAPRRPCTCLRLALLTRKPPLGSVPASTNTFEQNDGNVDKNVPLHCIFILSTKTTQADKD